MLQALSVRQCPQLAAASRSAPDNSSLTEIRNAPEDQQKRIVDNQSNAPAPFRPLLGLKPEMFGQFGWIIPLKREWQ